MTLQGPSTPLGRISSPDELRAMSPAELTDLAPRITQPVFVIWAPNGGNQETMSRVYYRLTRWPKQIWAMPTASHMAGISNRPAEYERRVLGFFDHYLVEGAPTERR